MVAIDVLLLCQVPPGVVLLNCELLPKSIALSPMIGFTIGVIAVITTGSLNSLVQLFLVVETV